MQYQALQRSKMSVKDLKNLVKTGEGKFLEFKRIISSPGKIAREMAALANTNGGTLLIGVDDDKSLVGLSSYHEQLYLLEQSVAFCEPAIHYTAEVLPYNYRDFLIVKIKRSANRPVFVKDGKRETVYIRVKDQSVRASREAIMIMRHQSSGKGATFEFGPYEQKLLRYLNEYERITVTDFSHLVNIGRNHASNILVNLVNAGILIFSQNGAQDYFSLARDVS